MTTPAIEGPGHATAALPLPASAALVGLDLTSQWFVLDGSASGGLAATSGLAWTIR